MGQIIYLDNFKKNILKDSYEPIKQDFIKSVSKNFKKRKNAVTILSNLSIAKIMYIDFLNNLMILFIDNEELKIILANHCKNTIKHLNIILSKIETNDLV